MAYHAKNIIVIFLRAARKSFTDLEKSCKFPKYKTCKLKYANIEKKKTQLIKSKHIQIGTLKSKKRNSRIQISNVSGMELGSQD